MANRISLETRCRPSAPAAINSNYNINHLSTHDVSVRCCLRWCRSQFLLAFSLARLRAPHAGPLLGNQHSID